MQIIHPRVRPVVGTCFDDQNLRGEEEEEGEKETVSANFGAES